jgi:hypothetical protein
MAVPFVAMLNNPWNITLALYVCHSQLVASSLGMESNTKKQKKDLMHRNLPSQHAWGQFLPWLFAKSRRMLNNEKSESYIHDYEDSLQVLFL